MATAALLMGVAVDLDVGRVERNTKTAEGRPAIRIRLLGALYTTIAQTSTVDITAAVGRPKRTSSATTMPKQNSKITGFMRNRRAGLDGCKNTPAATIIAKIIRIKSHGLLERPNAK